MLNAEYSDSFNSVLKRITFHFIARICLKTKYLPQSTPIVKALCFKKYNFPPPCKRRGLGGGSSMNSTFPALIESSYIGGTEVTEFHRENLLLIKYF